MRTAAIAGAVYFGVVFVVGFGLGTLRVLLVAPRLGAAAAVSLEAPLMLAASWLACGWCLRRFEIGSIVRARALMGVVAFTLLMTAEFAVSTLLFGRGAGDFIASYRTLAGRIGLGAQIVFGVVPILRLAAAGRGRSEGVPWAWR